MASENVSQTGQRPQEQLPSASPSPHARHAQPLQQQQQQQQHGQPYLPYQNTTPQQILMPMPYQNNTPGAVTYLTVPHPYQRPTESKSSKMSKYFLHGLILAMSVIGVGFAFSLLATGMNADRFSDYDYFNYYIPSLSAGPVFILAFLWSMTEIIVRCSRKWKAGIHPGAHVGVCLCLWMSAVIVGALLSLYISSPYIYSDCGVGTSSSGSSRTSYRHRECQLAASPLFVGVAVLTLLVACVEFVIFVLACVDTHLRKKWRRNLVIAPTPYWAPPPQGYYVAAGQQLQPHQAQYTATQQPLTGHTPMVMAPTPPVRQGVTAHPRAADSETQRYEPSERAPGALATPALPEHTVKEFYTPGTAS
ncbi:hypothetical protein E4U21_007644 [Claviceps maximensis]|nr:hypothetical protein E4U21_007644 [Claviceps maximensis]